MEFYYLLVLYVLQTKAHSPSPCLANDLTDVDLQEQRLVVKLVNDYSSSFNTTVILRSSRRNSTIYETSRFVQQQYTPVISQWLKRDARRDLYKYDRDLFGHDRRDVINLRSNTTYLVLLKDIQEWRSTFYIQHQIYCQGRRDSDDVHLYIGNEEDEKYAYSLVGSISIKYISSLLYSKSENVFHIFQYNVFTYHVNGISNRKKVYSNYTEQTKDFNLNQAFLDTSGNLYGLPIYFFYLTTMSSFIEYVLEKYLNASICKYNNCKYESITGVLPENSEHARDRQCSPAYRVNLDYMDKTVMVLTKPLYYYGNYYQYTSVFTISVWLLLGITYSTLFIVIKYVFKLNMTFHEMIYEFIFRPILQYAINISPHVNSVRVKTLLILMSVMGIILVTGFQAKQTIIMMMPLEEEQPNTLEELAKRNDFQVGFHWDENGAKIVLANDLAVDNETAQQLLSRGTFLQGGILKDFLSSRKSAYITLFLEVKLTEMIMIDSDGDSLMGKVNQLEGIMKYVYIQTVSNKCPYREKLATYISRSKNAGDLAFLQMSKFSDEIKIRLYIRNMKIRGNKISGGSVHSLRLQILSPCFTIFVCLLVASTIAIFIELYTHGSSVIRG